MIPFAHLRAQVDELSWRIEQAHTADDAHHLNQQCNELERAIQVQEDHLRHEVAQLEAAKALLRRLKARI